jgi:hypothetical protein
MTLMAEKEEALNQSEGDGHSNEEESCPACKISVALGMYLNVCKLVDSKEKCTELYNKVIKEEISPDELFKTVKEKAKDDKEQTEILEYIDSLVEDAKKE